MLRRVLVAQLLTVLLDSQGADPTRLMEAFPEEFTPQTESSDNSHKPAFPSSTARWAWSGASKDMREALLFLVDRHLVWIETDGRVLPVETHWAGTHGFSLDERDEGFGPRPLFAWDGANELRENADAFDFERRRFES